ncbi:MAG: bifunctional metallophosphatase/5'-nucleotidase [Pseudomonadales bacterium]|nr:bifunctional metallophosphatase/5'-nucleotidase [Pseudomonadales bacterium]
MTRSTLFIALFLINLVVAGCTGVGTEDTGIRQVTVLYTNDEHGWMEGMEEDQGAANLYALWQSREGYTSDGPFLVLSGGDNWTGPAISTWTQGESMVEVMNAMNYDASAVGNHEFDFGLEALKRRTAQARYPYLSANTRWKSNGAVPNDLGILPYSIITVNDVRFGIIGLTTRATPFVANPAYVADLNFIDYESALRETVPVVEENDPDILLVISHVCVAELEPLIRNTQDLGIAMMGAGHCNELVARRIGETVLLGGGYHFSSYARARFTFDTESEELLRTTFRANDYRNSNTDESVATLVSKWSQQMEVILSEEIAHLASTLPMGSEKLQQLIVNSWLEADPTADVAITNAGGIRTDLSAGLIDVRSMVALMPFDNTIIAATVTGATLEQAIDEGGRPVLGGLTRRGGEWIVERSGEPLRADQEYRVLLNSFMYAGGDNFGAIAEADPNGFDTGVNYRQPFQDWLKNQSSSRSNPLKF